MYPYLGMINGIPQAVKRGKGKIMNTSGDFKDLLRPFIDRIVYSDPSLQRKPDETEVQHIRRLRRYLKAAYEVVSDYYRGLREEVK